jgi:tetratricopeptide (TPR) repeat protein
MIDVLDIGVHLPAATAGDMAVINLKSACQHAWSRFWRAPELRGIAELVVEQEQQIAQFVGDLAAFDRLEMLVDELARVEPEAGRSALVAAQVACSTHRFTEARLALAQALACGAPSDATDRLSLSIDQATGANLPAVLVARRDRAAQASRWADRVPLGALLADLGEFDEAERTYFQALREYPDVSPFALAWVCFQLGVLWGECVPKPHAERAAQWYRTAIDYLPCYVKARVHLAEICLDQGNTEDARTLLAPALASGDPEVSWRLADVAEAARNSEEAATHLRAAQSGFEALLAKHPLAFADHAAEFYAGSGVDPTRAFELAKQNLANRPTLRAFEQAHATARAAGEARAATELLADARTRWGHTAAFQCSPLAMGTMAVAGREDRPARSLMNLTQRREEADART